jgi:Na+-driven multidrug efflux pump
LPLLVNFLGATPTISPYASDYLIFILGGAPFVITAFMLNNLLRFQGYAFLGMIGMVVGALLNIVLDPIFIFVLDMGIKGAAMATALCQILTAFLLFVMNHLHSGGVKILPQNFVPKLSIYKELGKGGLPSLLRQALLSIATLLLNRAAGGLGDAVIAAISIVNRIIFISGAALIGLGQGFQPVCGFNYGAREYERVQRAFYFCLRIATVFLLVLSIMFFIFAPTVVAFFRKDDLQVIGIGAYTLRLHCFVLPLVGWIVLVSMMLQTIGRAVAASFLAFARQGLFMFPLLFTIVPLFGIRGIQLCIPISDLCTFVMTIPFGISILHKLQNNRVG